MNLLKEAGGVLKRLCVECDCSVRAMKPGLVRSVEELEVVVIMRRVVSSTKRRRF